MTTNNAPLGHPARHPYLVPGAKCYVLGKHIPVDEGYGTRTLQKDHLYEAIVKNGIWKKRHGVYKLYVRVELTHTVQAWVGKLTQTFISEEICEDDIMRTPYGN